MASATWNSETERHDVFDTLTEKLSEVFGELGRKGKLTEADVDRAMRELRMALLEADVNYGVVKDFTARVKERAIGAEVMRSLSPAQQVVKIVHEELVGVLGQAAPLDLGRGEPPVILMAGLQGSGKTTTAAKLALMLRKRGKRPLLVACDTRRPAAIDQLEALGRQLGIPVYSEGAGPEPEDIAKRSLDVARRGAHNVVIIDTSGRLQVDRELMAEIVEISRRVQPAETLLVVDAMTGQEAVNVAEAFHRELALTGLILTKVDGDARGGAALSIRAVTGVPLKFLGVGEKTGALEAFEPERMAGRILGMGDVLALIERAEANMNMSEDELMSLEKRMKTGRMGLDDLLKQLQQIQRMGPLHELLGMIPGVGPQLKRQLAEAEVDGSRVRRIEAIIQSMTPTERQKPQVLNASRKRRVAAGSGTTVTELNQLLRQFDQMQDMMKRMAKGGTPRDLMGMFR